MKLQILKKKKKKGVIAIVLWSYICLVELCQRAETINSLVFFYDKTVQFGFPLHLLCYLQLSFKYLVNNQLLLSMWTIINMSLPTKEHEEDQIDITST